jgi:heavy metal-binding protein
LVSASLFPGAGSMKHISRALSCLFITLVLTQISKAGDWRGIVPLRSTRTEVERLLGAPQKGSRSVYVTENETISVVYADTECAYGWKIPTGTVVSFFVIAKKPLTLVDLKLDESKFVKRRDLHIETTYYYVNEKEGINYTVDVGRGVVTAVEYYPAANGNGIRCGPANDPSGKRKETSPLEESSVDPSDERKKIDKSAELSARARELERVATYEYTCLMHPEVHQAQAGRCPKCGMMLTTVKPSVRGEYSFSLEPRPLKPKAGDKLKMRFVISSPETGVRVTDYVSNHEKLFHLFIVSRDMTVYQHIHPRLERDGSFTVETVLPIEGLYKLHADFFPVGGTLQVIHRQLATAAYRAPDTLPSVLLTPDASLVKTVDGVRINLELNGSRGLTAGVLVPLKYRLTNERTGEPLRDLEPYLGAWGHTLILSSDQSEYLHSHPTEMLRDGLNRATARGGPEIEFLAMFPAAGDYRIWTQFQRAGKVITVFFTVRVVA